MSAEISGLAETQDCHCLAARKRAREVTRAYEDALRPVGLRATQFSVLAALAQLGSSPLTPLADLLGVERTTLTRSADLLVKRGLLREVQGDDRRLRRLRVTAEGASLLECALPLWRAVQRRIDEGEDDRERADAELRRSPSQKGWPA